MPESSFERQYARIEAAKKRVAEAKKLYPHDHAVVKELARKRDSEIKTGQEMERAFQVMQSRKAAKQQQYAPNSSSFLPQGTKPSTLSPGNLVNVPNTLAEIEARLQNPDRFGTRKPVEDKRGPQPGTQRHADRSSRKNKVSKIDLFADDPESINNLGKAPPYDPKPGRYQLKPKDYSGILGLQEHLLDVLKSPEVQISSAQERVKKATDRYAALRAEGAKLGEDIARLEKLRKQNVRNKSSLLPKDSFVGRQSSFAPLNKDVTSPFDPWNQVDPSTRLGLIPSDYIRPSDPLDTKRHRLGEVTKAIQSYEGKDVGSRPQRTSPQLGAETNEQRRARLEDEYVEGKNQLKAYQSTHVNYLAKLGNAVSQANKLAGLINKGRNDLRPEYTRAIARINEITGGLSQNGATNNAVISRLNAIGKSLGEYQARERADLEKMQYMSPGDRAGAILANWMDDVDYAYAGGRRKRTSETNEQYKRRIDSESLDGEKRLAEVSRVPKLLTRSGLDEIVYPVWAGNQLKNGAPLSTLKEFKQSRPYQIAETMGEQVPYFIPGVSQYLTASQIAALDIGFQHDPSGTWKQLGDSFNPLASTVIDDDTGLERPIRPEERVARSIPYFQLLAGGLHAKVKLSENHLVNGLIRGGFSKERALSEVANAKQYLRTKYGPGAKGNLLYQLESYRGSKLNHEVQGRLSASQMRSNGPGQIKGHRTQMAAPVGVRPVDNPVQTLLTGESGLGSMSARRNKIPPGERFGERGSPTPPTEASSGAGLFNEAGSGRKQSARPNDRSERIFVDKRDFDPYRLTDSSLKAVILHGDTAGIHDYIARDGHRHPQRGGPDLGHHEDYRDIVGSASQGVHADQQILKNLPESNGLSFVLTARKSTALSSAHGVNAYIAEIRASVNLQDISSAFAREVVGEAFDQCGLNRPATLREAKNILINATFRDRLRVIRLLGTQPFTEALMIPSRKAILEKIIAPHYLHVPSGRIVTAVHLGPKSGPAEMFGVQRHPAYDILNEGQYKGEFRDPQQLRELASEDYLRWLEREAVAYERYSHLSTAERMAIRKLIMSNPMGRTKILRSRGLRMQKPTTHHWIRSVQLNKPALRINEDAI